MRRQGIALFPASLHTSQMHTNVFPQINAFNTLFLGAIHHDLTVYLRNPKCYQEKWSSQGLNNLASHVSNLNHCYLKSSLLLMGSPQTCLILPFATPWSMPFSPNSPQDPILPAYICPLTQNSSPTPLPVVSSADPSRETGSVHHPLLYVCAALPITTCSADPSCHTLPAPGGKASYCTHISIPHNAHHCIPKHRVSKHPFGIIILTVLGQFIMTDTHLVTWSNQLLINHSSPDYYNN